MTRTIPRWGLVTAAPHEFLIQLRDGRVLRAQQGGSCWKRPGDAVTLVDTSVRRLQFTADQVTREKVGVAVKGLAVFRVVNPLLAYRMLNLEEPQTLQDILVEMFVGATRRLVANLSLEDCLTRRKDALAKELLAEVSPVVEGEGRDDDLSERGWGVALDTIEVQDVRVLSDEVFQRLQAPYREALALQALQARAAVAEEQHRQEEARVRREEEARRALMELEESRLEAERARARAAVLHEATLGAQALEAELARQEARTAAALREASARAKADGVLEDERAERAVRSAELQARAERALGEARAEVSRLERASVDTVSDARLRELLLTVTLPQMSQAFRDSYDRVVVTGGDLGFLGQGVTQVFATLQALGVELPPHRRPQGEG